MGQEDDNTPQQNPWRTVEHAARRADVGTKVIYSEIKKGRLRAARVGGRREFRLLDSWVDAWLIADSRPVEVSK